MIILEMSHNSAWYGDELFKRNGKLYIIGRMICHNVIDEKTIMQQWKTEIDEHFIQIENEQYLAQSRHLQWIQRFFGYSMLNSSSAPAFNSRWGLPPGKLQAELTDTTFDSLIFFSRGRTRALFIYLKVNFKVDPNYFIQKILK